MERVARTRSRWDWTSYQSALPRPTLVGDGTFDFDLTEEQQYEYALLTMDEESWRRAETQWLARRAAERKPVQGPGDELMVVWAEALRKSQERELRANDLKGRESKGG